MLKVGVVGATGYSGAKLVQLLLNHQEVNIVYLGSKSHSGMLLSDIYKNFSPFTNLLLENLELLEVSKLCDVVFLALPSRVAKDMITQEVLNNTVIIDLGADFRLEDPKTYETWYGAQAAEENILNQAIYGLTDIYKDKVKDTKLIANPGCYTTCSILSLAPLVQNKLINTETIIIDAKSGVTGAGKSLNYNSLYCEANENIKAYGITSHRHTPEIEQELSKLANKEIKIQFTPHLIPMNRGILATSYAKLKDSVTEEEIIKAYDNFYKDCEFVNFLGKDKIVETKYVKDTNRIDISFYIDKRLNNIIVLGAIDNLVKGASGQAIENMNLHFGFDQYLGLTQFSSTPL
ncbi:MAG: N-acetyl-gamma-glutamyl-phosphate reductase [Pleomorphochaeta sp.]